MSGGKPIEWAATHQAPGERRHSIVWRGHSRSVAGKRTDAARADTEAIIAIVEEKRAEVMRRGEAGYFIHDWQEISDQVRQMIFHDAPLPGDQDNRLQNKWR